MEKIYTPSWDFTTSLTHQPAAAPRYAFQTTRDADDNEGTGPSKPRTIQSQRTPIQQTDYLSQLKKLKSDNLFGGNKK